jgi:catechol 2,3-dioxygenase-like lactoylglutathione lyase family enzyme
VKLDHIFETALYVNDLETGRIFYERLLDTPSFANSPGRHVFFKLKHGMLLLFDPAVTDDPGADLPPHGCTGRGHLAFRVEEEELSHWRDRLAELKVPIEKEWIWPNGAPSVYFRDPAGNLLELTVARLWGF